MGKGWSLSQQFCQPCPTPGSGECCLDCFFVGHVCHLSAQPHAIARHRWVLPRMLLLVCVQRTCTVWDSFTANNIKALEKFQKWAVRWVKQDYSTSSIEDQCVWTTCENNCTGSGRKQAHSHLTTLELQVPPWSHPHQIKHCPSPANRPRRTTWNHLTYPDLMYDIPSHQTELYRQKTFFQSGTAFLKKWPQHPPLAPLRPGSVSS